MQSTSPRVSAAHRSGSAGRRPDPGGLLLGQHRDEFSGAYARLGLARREPLEPQPGHLAPPLLPDPRALLREHALDLRAGRPLRHGQPRRLAPRHFQPPLPCPPRAPHLDRVHPRERSLRFGRQRERPSSCA